jgi:DNA-binding beta-propeller fold protein YncE
VANNSNNTIEKYTTGGVGSVFATGTNGLNGPTGLAFDSSGNLFVANFNSNTIDEITPGGVSSVFATAGLSGPAGLAFDSAGNLYAANFNTSKIEKYTPGGAPSLFASTGRPQFLAFTNDSGVPLPLANQLPEPSSLCVMALGGIALFRRPRRRGR